MACRVNKGEAGALATTVGERGGCLQVAAHHLLQGRAGGKSQGGKEDLGLVLFRKRNLIGVN